MSKRTIKVTGSEINEAFKNELFGEEIKGVLNEELSASDKSAVKSIVQNEIRDFLKLSRNQSFDKLVEGMVQDYVKKDKDLEKHIVEINKNVLIQLYKTLWTRRSFWANDLKNATS